MCRQAQELQLPEPGAGAAAAAAGIANTDGSTATPNSTVSKTMFIMTCFSRLAFNHFHHKIGRMYLAASLELQPAAIGAGLGERGVYIQFAAFHRRVRVDKLL